MRTNVKIKQLICVVLCMYLTFSIKKMKKELRELRLNYRKIIKKLNKTVFGSRGIYVRRLLCFFFKDAVACLIKITSNRSSQEKK